MPGLTVPLTVFTLLYIGLGAIVVAVIRVDGAGETAA